MSVSQSRLRRDDRHWYRIRTRNGSDEKLATLTPQGWKIEDRADHLSMEHFIGNYEFVEDK